MLTYQADRLCSLLLKSTKQGKPINIARAFRAVALDIMEDFVYDSVPDHLRGLKDEHFDTLFVHTTFDVMDWTAWCFRNFPFTLTLSNQIPQWVRRLILPGEAANIESFNVRPPVSLLPLVPDGPRPTSPPSLFLSLRPPLSSFPQTRGSLGVMAKNPLNRQYYNWLLTISAPRPTGVGIVS